MLSAISKTLTIMGCLCAVALSVPVLAESGEADAPWTLRKEEKGISVYTKAVPHSVIDVIRAEKHLDVPYERVVETLLKYENRPAWNSLCRQATRLPDTKGDASLVYIYYSMPWPVSDRQLVMSFRPQRTEGAFVLAGKATDQVKMPEESPADAVRVTDAWEEWRIEPRGSGTQVSMTVFMDPAGPIPGWLINKMSISQPIEVLLALERVAKDEGARS